MNWISFSKHFYTFTSREISYLERSKGDGFLVVVVPGAPELPGLVENLLNLRVVLNDDRGLHVAARGVGLTTSLRLQAS